MLITVRTEIHIFLQRCFLTAIFHVSKKSTQISYKKCLIYLLKCYTIDLLFRFKEVTVKMCDTEEFDSKIKSVYVRKSGNVLRAAGL